MMGIEIFDCEQNSEEWTRLRLGLVTCSEFSTVMAKDKNGKDNSAIRRTYLYKLAGQIITGEPGESYQNAAMSRGHSMEGDARDRYAFQYNVEPQRVGFVKNGRKGCSPDSFIGSDGGLEIKSKDAHILIACMKRDDPPPEHKAQLQGFLWVCEREWVDFVAYWPKMPLVVHRVTRDNGYIANMVGEVDRFNDELDALVEWIGQYGKAA